MMKMNGNESPTLVYSAGINRMAIHVFVTFDRIEGEEGLKAFELE